MCHNKKMSNVRNTAIFIFYEDVWKAMSDLGWKKPAMDLLLYNLHNL